MNKLGINGGIRFDQIDQARVEIVNYSTQDNLIFKYKGETDWKFVFDEKGQRIPRLQIHELTKAIANPAALDWLVSQIGKK